MKTTIRVPSNLPYAYLEREVEGDDGEVVRQFNALYKAVNAPQTNDSMPEDTFLNLVSDIMEKNLDRPMTSAEWESCSPSQKRTLNEIQKFKKRLIAGKEILEDNE